MSSLLRASAILLTGGAMAALGCSDEKDHEDGHGGDHSHSDGGSDSTGDGDGDDHGHGGDHSHSHGDGDGDNTDHEDKCCLLGAICHVVGDDVDPEVEACHVLGHANEASVCDEEFERCYALCEGLTEDPVEHACY